MKNISLQVVRMSYLIVGIVVFFSGCTFGVDSSATPQNVYKKVMKLYRQNYAYIHEAPKSPSEIYNLYWPRVSPLNSTNKGWTQLAVIFYELLCLIEDEHISFDFDGRQIKEKDECQPEYSPLPNPSQKVTIDEDLLAYKYGKVTDNLKIGYILIKKLSNDDLNIFERVNDNQEWLKKIDTIIKRLKSAGVKKMILDIRSDAGGSQTNAEFIISRFIKSEKAYMASYDLTGPADNKANYKREVISIRPPKNQKGAEHFSGPVVLLQDKNTGSGGEIFVLAARQIPGIKTIGDFTAGLPGTIAVYDLPNYWTLQLTTSKTFPVNSDGSDGETYLKEGIKPDIKVKNAWSNDPNDGKTPKDEILKKGIQVIQKIDFM